MKVYKSYLFILLYIGTSYSACDNHLSEDIAKELRTNRLGAFVKLSKLYEPVLNFMMDSAKFKEEWDSINTYITCGIRQYLSRIDSGKYTPDSTKVFGLFDRIREDLQTATNDINEKKKKHEIKENLNLLYTDKDEVFDVLNASLKALDKSVPAKINPEIIMPGYKNFYKELVKFAAKSSSKPVETLNAERTIVFLTNYQDKFTANILPKNSYEIGDKMIFSKDPSIIKKAKYFAIKLQEVMYALKSDTSFEIPFFGSSRSTQAKVLQKVIKILQDGFGFDITTAIPVTKLASLKDMILFCMIAEAVGLYDALKEVINYINPDKKKKM